MPATIGSQQIFIGITVDPSTPNDATNELSPRARLTTSPYAFQAQSAYTISDNAVTNSKLANDAVTTAKILDGTILGNDISAGAAIAGTKISPAFGSQNISTTGTLTSGVITGSSFNYSAPKTKYLNISTAAFPIVTNLSGATIVTYRFVSPGSSMLRFADGIGFTPIYLPDGATVTNLTFSSGSCDGSDACNGEMGGQVVVRLLRQLGSNTNLIVLASATAPAQTSGITSTSVITNSVIDNENYSYQLSVQITGGSASTAFFYGARITYTTTGTN